MHFWWWTHHWELWFAADFQSAFQSYVDGSGTDLITPPVQLVRGDGPHACTADAVPQQNTHPNTAQSTIVGHWRPNSAELNPSHRVGSSSSTTCSSSHSSVSTCWFWSFLFFMHWLLLSAVFGTFSLISFCLKYVIKVFPKSLWPIWSPFLWPLAKRFHRGAVNMGLFTSHLLPCTLTAKHYNGWPYWVNGYIPRLFTYPQIGSRSC